MRSRITEATDLKQRIDSSAGVRGWRCRSRRYDLSGRDVRYRDSPIWLSNKSAVTFRVPNDEGYTWESGIVDGVEVAMEYDDILGFSVNAPSLNVMYASTQPHEAVRHYGVTKVPASYTRNYSTGVGERVYYWDPRDIHASDPRMLENIEKESALQLKISEAQDELEKLTGENDRIKSRIDKIAEHHEKRGLSAEWNAEEGVCVQCQETLTTPEGGPNQVIQCSNGDKITIHAACVQTIHNAGYDPKSLLCRRTRY